MAKKRIKKSSKQGKTVSKDRLASSSEPLQRRKTVVGGFNPEVDFGEILNTWERTGEVELNLSTKKSKSASRVKRSFGEILAEWEKESTPKKATATAAIKKSDPYQATQDFGELLDAFEGKRPQRERPLVTQEPKKQHPKKGQRKRRVQEELEIPLRPTEEMAAALSEKAELDAERGESIAAWSFADTYQSGAKRRAPKKRRPTEEVAQKESTPLAPSAPYVPTEDFGALLASFEEQKRAQTPKKGRPQKSKQPTKTPQELPLRPTEKIKAALDEKRELDSERGTSEAAWSFADTYRFWSKQADEEQAIKESQNQKKEMEAKVESIAELRALLPEETLDLHGLTVKEAEVAVASFLTESQSAGLRKLAIITGKGLHNELGYSPVKEAALEQIRLSGVVREAFTPKARYGGSGAIWIILKRE